MYNFNHMIKGSNLKNYPFLLPVAFTALFSTFHEHDHLSTAYSIHLVVAYFMIILSFNLLDKHAQNQHVQQRFHQ